MIKNETRLYLIYILFIQHLEKKYPKPQIFFLNSSVDRSFFILIYCATSVTFIRLNSLNEDYHVDCVTRISTSNQILYEREIEKRKQW